MLTSLCAVHTLVSPKYTVKTRALRLESAPSISSEDMALTRLFERLYGMDPTIINLNA